MHTVLGRVCAHLLFVTCAGIPGLRLAQEGRIWRQGQKDRPEAVGSTA